MTLTTSPVSAEDVPPESVGVGLQTSTVSAPLLGGTWLVGLVGFPMCLTIGLLAKKGFLIVRCREPDGQTQQRVDGRAV